jgi:capsular exopolysaccharide synthesis family protein
MQYEQPKHPTELTSWRKTATELAQPVPYNLPLGGLGPGNAQKTDYAALIWRRKYWLILAALVGLAVGFGWVILQVPVYRSSTTLEIVGFNESFMGMNKLDPQAGTGSYGPNASNILTQLQVLASPSLLRKVSERVTLEQPPIPPPSGDFWGRIRNRLGLIPQEPVDFVRLAIRTAAATSAAKGAAASRIIDVSSESPSPEIAAAFVNALAQEYITQNGRFRASAAARTTQWLEGQIEEAKTRMDRADESLQDFIKQEGLAFVIDQNTLADSKLRQLQLDLSTVQSERINKQSRYELAKSSPVDSLPEILDDGTLRGLRDHLTELRKERAQLTATLMPGHIKVRRVDAQIAELEKTMQVEKGNLVRRIQNDYEAALRREKLLAGSYASQSKSLAGQAEKAVKYNQLKREVEMARQAHDLLLQQYNETAVVAAVPTNNIRIVDTAEASSMPSKPEPIKNIATSTGLVIVLSMALIVLLEMIRTKRLERIYSSPGLTTTSLNLPELGVIPAFEARPVRRYRLSRAGRVQAIPSANPGGLGTDLAAWVTPSYVTESFRQTLASLQARQADRKHSMIVVTSAGPGEGKTTLLANLAAATAETGRRVLMIDGDLRRPRLHKVFNTEIGVGISDLLQSEVPISQLDLADFIRPTSVAGVSLLSCGSAKTLSVGAMLFSLRLPQLFTRLREEFDFVLVDTAPGMQFSDARLFSRLCDGAILVVRSGLAFRESVIALVQRFAHDGTPILGTVLNDWNPDTSGTYGPYGYDYKKAYQQYHSSE